MGKTTELIIMFVVVVVAVIVAGWISKKIIPA